MTRDWWTGGFAGYNTHFGFVVDTRNSKWLDPQQKGIFLLRHYDALACLRNGNPFYYIKSLLGTATELGNDWLAKHANILTWDGWNGAGHTPASLMNNPFLAAYVHPNCHARAIGCSFGESQSYRDLARGSIVEKICTAFETILAGGEFAGKQSELKASLERSLKALVDGDDRSLSILLPYLGAYKFIRSEVFEKVIGCEAIGPGGTIGLRPDSKMMLVEPEFVPVYDAYGSFIGITLGNDVSASDLEKELILYLFQSKVFDGCASLGPAIYFFPTPVKLDADVAPEILKPAEWLMTAAVYDSTGQLRKNANASYPFAACGREPLEIGYFAMQCHKRTRHFGTMVYSGTGWAPRAETDLHEGDVVVQGCQALFGDVQLITPASTVFDDLLVPHSVRRNQQAGRNLGATMSAS